MTAGEQVRIRSFGGAGRTPVWLTGPVTVRRAPGVLVVGRTDDGERVLRLAAAAVPVVRRVLPDWTPRLVVEVPATAAALDDALGAEPGDLRRRGRGDRERRRVVGPRRRPCTSTSTRRSSAGSAPSAPRW